MPEVKWLPEALDDIERLHAFLRDRNPQAAARAVRIILEGAELLETAPRIGHPMPDDTARREWFMSFAAGAYVLRYTQEDDNTVVIIRVWHSREGRK